MRRPRRAVAALAIALVTGAVVALAAAAYPRSLVVGGPVEGLRGTTNRPTAAERLPVRLSWARGNTAIVLTARAGCRYRVVGTTSTAPNRIEVTLAPDSPRCSGTGPAQRLRLPPPTVFGPPDAVTVLIDGHGYPMPHPRHRPA